MSICTSLDVYFEMGSPMSENKVKESQSHVASHHPPKRGMGRYRLGTTLDITVLVLHYPNYKL